MTSQASRATPHTLLAQAFHEVAIADNGSDDADATRTRLLDAAYEQFCATGITRTSMEEVARRAGTARITIYRKFENKDALVNAVMLREFRRYVTAYRDEIAQARTVQERVVAAFVTSLREIGGNPLITRLMETDGGMAPALIGGGDGRTMIEVRHFIAEQIAQEQRAGQIPAGVSTDLAAEMVVRLCSSLLTRPSDLIDLSDTAALESLAREFALPLLGLRDDA